MYTPVNLSFTIYKSLYGKVQLASPYIYMGKKVDFFFKIY